jgi:AcrR family transcriptional regulator
MDETPASHGRAGNRELILGAAREEIIERGYPAVTIRSIARRVRVDPGLVRYYFESKEALMAEAVGEFDLSAALADAAGTPVERVAALWVSRPLEWQALIAAGVSTEPRLRDSLAAAAEAFARLYGTPDDHADLRSLLIFGQVLGIWMLTRAQAEGAADLRERLVRHVAG